MMKKMLMKIKMTKSQKIYDLKSLQPMLEAFYVVGNCIPNYIKTHRLGHSLVRKEIRC